MDNEKNLRNRPKVTENKDTQAARDTGQLNSYDNVLRNDPATYYYNKLNKNQYFREDFWSEAARRGESEQLISLLQSTENENFSSEIYDVMSGYGDRMDYDGYMLSLQFPHLDNTEKTPRVDSDVFDEEGNQVSIGTGYEYGEFTDQEWANEIVKHTIGGWEAEIIEEDQKNRNFFAQLGTQTVAGLTNVVGGALQFVGDIYNLGEGALNLIFNWTNDEGFDRFTAAYANDEGWSNPFAKVGEWMNSASYEFQRQYGTTVNAIDAHNEGYTLGSGSNFLQQIDKATGVGAGYTTWGRWMNAGTNAIGYMVPTILLGVFTGGASTAASGASAGTAGLATTVSVGTKVAAGLNKARSLVFYAGIFSGSVKDEVSKAKMNGISYRDLNGGRVIANAAVKSVAQYAVEKALGMVLGFSGVDKMLGIGGKTVAQAGAKTIGKTVGSVMLGGAKNALKEGLEESLQELSDFVVNYAFGDSYRNEALENISIQNIVDSFIVGAMTSVVMGSFNGITTQVFSPTHGIDSKGELFKLGLFQNLNLRQSMETMHEWKDTIDNPKASLEKKASAMLSMNLAAKALGDIYHNMGTERAVKADAIINDMLNTQDKVERIAKLNTATAYSNAVWDDFKKAQSEASAKYVTKQIADQVKKEIARNEKKLKKGKVSAINNVVTDATQADSSLPIQSEALVKLQKALAKFGVEALVGVDGDIVTKSNQVVFVDNKLVEAGDIENILKGITYDLAISTVGKNLTPAQKKMITKSYSRVLGREGSVEEAITALLFDKSFYTQVLLLSRERRYQAPALQVLSTLDKLIKAKVTPNVKNGTITADAYRLLLTKVQDTMRTGLVTFATQYQMIDLGNVDNAILPAELIAEINNHRNVKFTNLINEGVKNKASAFTSDKLDTFDKAIDQFVSSENEGVRKLLKAKARSHNYNERVDAYVMLTHMAETAKNNEKLIYLPTDSTNTANKLAIEQVVEAFGVSWEALLSGKYDPNALTPAIQDFIVTNGYDMANQRHRYAAIREVLYTKSGKTLTLGLDGTLLEVLDKESLAKPQYLGEDGDMNLYMDIIQKKILTVQDLSNVKLDDRIGSAKIIINDAVNVSNDGKHKSIGMYKAGSNEIVLDASTTTGSFLDIIMHEATHITQYVTGTEIESISGGTPKLFDALPADIKKSLVDYISSNFPISYGYLRKNGDSATLYYMLAGEMQASSKLASHMFEVGFTWKSDGKTTMAGPDGTTVLSKKAILVSPDGTREWPITAAMKPNETTKAADAVAKGATKVTKNTGKLIDKVDKNIAALKKQAATNKSKKAATEAVDENTSALIFWNKEILPETEHMMYTRSTEAYHIQRRKHIIEYTGYYADYKKVYNNLRKDVPEIDKWSRLGQDHADTMGSFEHIGKEHTEDKRAAEAKLKQDLVDKITPSVKSKMLEATRLKMLPNLHMSQFMHTDIPYIRVQTREDVSTDPFVSVVLGYSDNMTTILDMFKDVKERYIYTGTIKPKDMIGIIPSSEYEGLITPAQLKKSKVYSAEYIQSRLENMTEIERKAPVDKVTKGQEAYFKDSKVRDSNGKLLKVYHGTNVDFKIFDASNKKNGQFFGKGYYFTDVESNAKGFADHATAAKGEPSIIKEVYLNITKPLEIDWPNRKTTLDPKVRETFGLRKNAVVTDEHIQNYLNKMLHNDPYLIRKNQERPTDYDGVIVRNVIDGVGHVVESDVYVAVDKNQIKEVTNENPTDHEAINKKVTLKTTNLTEIEKKTNPNSRTMSNEEASKSNMKRWIEVGKKIQVDPSIKQFVIATTDQFNKLPKVLRDKIRQGKLTKHDITNFVATSSNTNIFTHKAIAKYIYKNEALAKITPAQIRALTDGAEVLATLNNIVEDSTDQLTPDQMFDLAEEIRDKIDNGDNDLGDRYLKSSLFVTFFKLYTDTGAPNYVDIEADPLQMAPAFYNHYDGTIRGMLTIYKITQKISAKQSDLSGDASTMADTTNSEDAVTIGGKSYKWINNKRQTDTDYEYISNEPLKVQKVASRQEKLEALEKHITEALVKKANTMSEAEKKAEGPKLMAELNRKLDKLYDWDDAKLDEQYNKYVDRVAKAHPEVIAEPELEIKGSRSMKNVKDQLRQTARNVTTRIAKYKRRYNSLPEIVKANIDPNTYKLNDNYKDKARTQEELETLLTAMKQAASQLNSIIKSVEIKKQVAEATQKRLDKLAKEKIKTEQKTEKKTGQKPNLKTIIQNFTFDSREEVTDIAKKLLSTQWGKTKMSQVQGLTTNVEQNVHNGKVFFTHNAETLMNMTTAQAEATVLWFMDANIHGVAGDSPEAQTFAAVKVYFLGYMFSQSTNEGQFPDFSAAIRNRLENNLKSHVTAAGTSLAVWNNIRGLINPVDAMKEAHMEMGGVPLTDQEKSDLMDAAVSNDFDKIAKVTQDIIDRVNEAKKPNKDPNLPKPDLKTRLKNMNKSLFLRKITTLRSMAMLSGPLTWLRNPVSNASLKRLNRFASKIGNAIGSKFVYKGQLKMTKKATPEIEAFINKEFIDNKLFDTLVSNLSRYNPSDIQPRFKDALGRASKDAIFHTMVIKSMYNQYYNQNMFNNPKLNKVHQSLMKLLSDNKYVKEASLRYFGQIIAERAYTLDQGVTDAIMNDFASSIGLAMADYMHSDNVFTKIENVLAEQSEGLLFTYKLFLPFAKAQWNWFKAAMRYSPVGLVQSFVKLTKLEQQVIKAESDWAQGKSQISADLTESLIKRDLGAGVIGTMSLIFGGILAALGFVELEDDDYGIPKLRVGNIRVDVSTIFGSSSVLAGMALVQSWSDEENTFMKSMDAMLDPLLDGFFMTQLLEMDQYNRGGFGSFGASFLEQTLLSFIPNGLRYASNVLYTGKYKTNNMLERAIVKLPFIRSAFLDKETNPYTGKQGDAWDIFNRVIPYLSVRQTSAIEDESKQLGINKKQLRGTYTVNDKDFTLTTKETAELNKIYGEWNAEALTAFYGNQSKVSVLMPDGSYRTLSYDQMSDKQRSNAVQNLISKNAEYAKILAWIKAGNTYYASANDYLALRKLGINGKLYKGTKGFVEN